MKCLNRLVPVAAVLFVLALAAGGRAEMKDELKIDKTNIRRLRTLFSTYGYQPGKSIFEEADGLRYRLPADVPGVAQTGVYSYFALAGDCEVIFSYEFLTLQNAKKGYGSGVGLAFDVGEGVARAAIQRVHKPKEGNTYVLQTSLPGAGGKMQDEEHFAAATAKRGQLGLRRIQKELIFLAADGPGGELLELERQPFTDRTIRVVRIFADAGGSPTAVDVRVRQIVVRSEELTGGVPQRDEAGSSWGWLWLSVPVAGGGVLFWLWRTRWRRSDDEEDQVVRRKAPLKKA